MKLFQGVLSWAALDRRSEAKKYPASMVRKNRAALHNLSCRRRVSGH